MARWASRRTLPAETRRTKDFMKPETLTDKQQRPTAVVSSGLVVLLGQWKQEVTNLNAALASDEEAPAWQQKDAALRITARRSAYASCIADLELLMQHNAPSSDAPNPGRPGKPKKL
jgi:hypothetical protein